MAMLQGIGYAAVGPKPSGQVSGTLSGATSQLPSDQTSPAPSGTTTTQTQTDQAATTGDVTGTTATAPPGGDSPGHTTPSPGPPDHASGSVAEVSLAGNDLVDVGETNSQVNDDGSSNGDVTVLAIGGQEIIGAHSDSTGPQSASSNPFGPLCSGSGGAVCLQLLFADTNSSSSATAAHSDATSQVAGVCLGGSGTTPQEACSGAPVTVGVATTSSSIDRDKTTGAESATQTSDLANACVGGANADGVCSGVGADAVHSESSSSVNGNQQAQTTHSSYLANVELGGQSIVVISDPTAITIPPGCPPGTSLLCLFLNQSTENVSTGVAGSRQEAIHISVLAGAVGGQDLVLSHLGVAESFVRFSPPTCCVVHHHPRAHGPRTPPQLAFTGFGMGLPLAVLVFLVGAAMTLLGLERRRLAVA